MEIDAVDIGSSYYEDLDARESSARVLGKENGIRSLQLETRQQGDFSLRSRKDGIKPMMHCIREVDLGYKRTNEDGSSNEVNIKVKLGEDKNAESASSANNENDTRAPDIDSRDRDYDHDNG